MRALPLISEYRIHALCPQRTEECVISLEPEVADNCVLSCEFGESNPVLWNKSKC